MRTIRQNAILFLKGMGMGAADVIPGVSGGTIAFITGIYEELINSIKSVDGNAIKLLFSGQIKIFWERINGSFLLVLVSGIVLSLVSLAKLIIYLMEYHPIPLWSFFFGLILISAFIVVREVEKFRIRVVLAGIAGIAIAYFITTATPAETPEALWFIFLAGCIAISAMILPGISGSFILLILAKYQFIIESLSTFNVPVLIVFGLGCIVGLAAFSRIISWIFTHYHDLTVALLSGFMIGSLNKVWPWKEVISYRMNSAGEQVPAFTRSISPGTYFEITGENPLLLEAVFYAALGIMIVIGLEKLADYLNNRV
jgi:putative membrane protein